MDAPARPHLASLLDDFRRHGHTCAIVRHQGIRSTRTTYAELAHLAGRVAAELHHRHILPGERVVLFGANSAEWIASFFGCLQCAVLVVPLDRTSPPALVARVLAEVSPRLVLCDPDLVPNLPHDLEGNIPTLLLPDLPHSLPTKPLLAVSDAVHRDTPFQIVFTSGTTADPKGIVHTHGNVLASLQPIESGIARYRAALRIVRPLRLLHTLPLSHVFGQFMGLWIPALLGAELHLTDSADPAQLVYFLHRDRISVLVAVPRVLDLLRTHLLTTIPSLASQLASAASLTPLQRWLHFRAVHSLLGWKFWAVISGGAALPDPLERFWNALGIALIQGYGMTETAALVSLNHPFHIARGTIGKPLPGREVRLAPNGEILVRGDVVSTATWQHGQLQPRTADWLATGDLAEQTPSGELRFLSRSGDAIVTAAGLNIFPTDLEAILAQQPGVQACVVVPCPTPVGTEPVAVLLFAGSDAALTSVITAANSELATFQHIRRVLRWPGLQLPYTSTGKLLRREVAAWACEHLEQQRSKPTTAEANDTLLTFLAEITGDPTPPGDDTRRLTEDFHLDSLARVQLSSALSERLGLPLDEDRFAAAQTLGDLRALFHPPDARSALPEPQALPLPSAQAALLPLAATAAPNSPHPPPSDDSVPIRSTALTAARAKSHYTQDTASPSLRSPKPLPYPRWPSFRPVRALRSVFLRCLIRPLARLLAKPRILGSAPPPSAGPFLIIANHVTALDPALVLAALPAPQSSRLTIAMSGEMLSDFRHARAQGSTLRNLLAPAAYWLLTALFNVFPLPRLRGFQRSFQHAGEALDRGDSVLIFPEGARARSTALQPFRPGIGLLAQQARVPVLPIALLGLHQARHTRWLRSGLLQIHIGAPIPYTETRSPADWTTLLESTMHHLLP